MMCNFIAKIFTSGILLIFGVAFARETKDLHLGSREISISVPADFSIERKSIAPPSVYAKGKCYDFLLLKQELGIFCGYEKPEFLSDLGISKEQVSKENEEYYFATGMSRYVMKSSKIKDGLLYEASVDCDEQDGSVYRPTSTCYVAIFFSKKYNGFIYANFILKNEMEKIEKMPEDAAKKILRSIKIHR